MQEISNRNVVNRKGMNHWNRILDCWIELNSEYSNIEKDDAAYWYTELTNVGILSGAAWRAGWVSLTETQIMKGARHRPKHYGRSDLYIANKKHGEYIEAKFQTVSFDHRSEFREVINDKITMSRRDAKSTSGRDEYYSTAILFVVPSISESRLSNKRDANDARIVADKIYDMIQDLEDEKHHIKAWCFPRKARLLSDGCGKVWPGVLLVGDNVHLVDS